MTEAATVEIVAAVLKRVGVDDADAIIEAGSVIEAAEEIVSDLINGLPDVKAGIESWDYTEVTDYGDFADPAECPECDTEYADEKTVEYIRRHDVCPDCPDPELEGRE
jgi:hypothetical protein